ncbi:hypothetical protein PP175_28575 (plasmid) [Aneurinibacillus sp. Ricciae_BoGa-3]|uniref:hypothetical protein n=1 Tax=Aneurinibacillus sp. Ricciae_BoGa-3 TaxID=3022697 RepID=UPI002341E2BB|nr:hypothetical protein [Aneurinibacillus sp. Ricciae_BoGa-3]WCK57147.1 hypothetical protein PP175_28575 [Aneurinibacillus sp. Ricciae_BoGa-3]
MSKEDLLLVSGQIQRYAEDMANAIQNEDKQHFYSLMKTVVNISNKTLHEMDKQF